MSTIPEGTVYVFVDGAFVDGACGCGVVFVLRKNGAVTTREFSLSPAEATAMVGLDGTLDVPTESARLRNVFAELLAFLAALSQARAGSSLVVVHDYEGIAAWFRGEWRARDHLVRRLVSAAHRMVLEKAMAVEFRHRRSQGDGESAAYIRTADRLASMAARRAAHR
jgi:ribonuclease HI